MPEFKPAPRRAVVIFAKAPRHGNVKTRLGKRIGMRAATTVYKQLLNRSVMAALEAQAGQRNLDVLISAPAQRSHPSFRRHYARGAKGLRQARGDLGKKMQHCIGHALKQYQQVVITGTDAPGLTDAAIKQAFQLLQNAPLAFLPANDGGYVLLASRVNTKAPFQRIAWSSGHELQQTRNRLRRAKLPFLEGPLFTDIDSLQDYKQARRQGLLAALNSSL